MKIKCSCGKPECSGAIWFEKTYDHTLLWFTNDLSERELSIYLDANGLLELIKQGRNELLCLTEK